jgi:hypothetical protein
MTFPNACQNLLSVGSSIPTSDLIGQLSSKCFEPIRTDCDSYISGTVPDGVSVRDTCVVPASTLRQLLQGHTNGLMSNGASALQSDTSYIYREQYLSNIYVTVGIVALLIFFGMTFGKSIRENVGTIVAQNVSALRSSANILMPSR